MTRLILQSALAGLLWLAAAAASGQTINLRMSVKVIVHPGTGAWPPGITAQVFTNAVAAANEWSLLREHTERQLASPNPAVVRRARQMLALAMAHAPEEADRRIAIRQYQALVKEGLAEPADRARLAVLLHGSGELDAAKQLLRESLEGAPPAVFATLMELGQRFVAETGDRALRQFLETAKAKRGNHD